MPATELMVEASGRGSELGRSVTVTLVPSGIGVSSTSTEVVWSGSAPSGRQIQLMNSQG